MAIHSKNQTTVEGLDELIAAFQKLGDDALPYLMQGSNEAGSEVLRKAVSKVPVDSGNLKRKLKVIKAKKSAKYPYRVFSKVTFPKGAAYAVPLELGHNLIIDGKKVGVIKELPFLRPAADESKETVVKAIADSMNKALGEMGGMR
ncbi:HK97 gp10 family phage protein [Gudongella oleilytica]|uniref:HK97 gp10 family phage protein n=1 Tax=Gudongella oleilytica TaxID=1582259 RepID=UPI000FF890A6|nr:HK97 gp10 family phage protein [Gudongella oleilytica]